jgi:anti-sigma factor RsiW
MTPTLNPMKRHHERCHEVRAQMSDYLDGDLDSSATAAVERHTRWCPNCRRVLTNLSRTLGGLRALRNEPTPADEPRAET